MQNCEILNAEGEYNRIEKIDFETFSIDIACQNLHNCVILVVAIVQYVLECRIS